MAASKFQLYKRIKEVACGPWPVPPWKLRCMEGFRRDRERTYRYQEFHIPRGADEILADALGLPTEARAVRRVIKR